MTHSSNASWIMGAFSVVQRVETVAARGSVLSQAYFGPMSSTSGTQRTSVRQAMQMKPFFPL